MNRTTESSFGWGDGRCCIFSMSSALALRRARAEFSRLGSRRHKVEAIGVHHLVPRRHEVFYELLLRV